MECLSTGDGSPWQDAWIHEVKIKNQCFWFLDKSSQPYDNVYMNVLILPLSTAYEDAFWWYTTLPDSIYVLVLLMHSDGKQVCLAEDYSWMDVWEVRILFGGGLPWKTLFSYTGRLLWKRNTCCLRFYIIYHSYLSKGIWLNCIKYCSEIVLSC